MKKIISTILVLILIGIIPTLVACKNDSTTSEPVYAETYTYDDTHHWYAQTNGDGVKDYAEHYNPSGTNCGKCKCGYYFPCINLVYEKKTINGVEGYEVVDYDEYMSPNFYHVEVPKYYQGEDDTEPLPVISIYQYALSNRASTATATYGKCDIKLQSVKLNEGLLKVGNGAFCHSNIKEITIPNSVKGTLVYTFMQCPQLERIVIGDGITGIGGYVFYGLPKCEEIILGNSITEIVPRSFIDCKALKSVVLPSSLISIPEGSIKGNANGCDPQIHLFMNSGKPDIYLNITKEELEERTIPLFPRDENANLLNPDGSIAHKVTITYESDGVTVKSYTQHTRTKWGMAEGWQGSCKLYYVDEWHYNEKGQAVPN